MKEFAFFLITALAGGSMFAAGKTVSAESFLPPAALEGSSSAASAEGALAPAPDVALDEDSSDHDQEILNKYLSATQEQQNKLRGVSMEVEIDAEVPKLKKQGNLRALRSISKLGKITYNMLGFMGDKTIKNEVIARYLSAETQAQTGPDISITPANYKFKLKGIETQDNRDVYVFRLTPRKKRVGLFKGELWVDVHTYMPVREAGRFVKSPSIFLKKMEFVRDYSLENGLAVPSHLESKVDTRLFGTVELNISFTHFAQQTDQDVAATPGADTAIAH